MLFYHICSSIFIIDLYFLIHAVIARMFIPIAEIVAPTGTQTNEAKEEIETQPVTVEAIISKLTVCSCHVTYAFQSESTLYSCQNVKELLARSRREI